MVDKMSLRNPAPVPAGRRRFHGRLQSFLLLGMLYAGVFATPAHAAPIPNLQLDIAGGTYDYATQTIIAPGSSFTLYAYLYQQDVGNYPLNDTYYISAALVPQTTNPAQGTFTFNSPYFNPIYNGTSYNNTVNLATDPYADYGVPPHYDANQLSDPGDLDPHGIFYTWFKEFKFIFKTSDQIGPYDTVARAKAGTPIQLTGTGMYYASFQVDTSNLSPGNEVHFDIYTLYPTVVDGNLTVNHYAPFGYDAQSDPPNAVPEPSTVILLGSGLVGLGLGGRRKFKARN